MKKAIYILGINHAYHEHSAALLRNGELIVAVEEERLNRFKHGDTSSNPDVLPFNSIEFCLKKEGISIDDVSHIGLSFWPKGRLKNIEADSYFNENDWGSKNGELLFYKKILSVPEKLSAYFNYNIIKKIHWIPHHLCHAASTYLVSPFNSAAVLSIDGIGEFNSTWIGYGRDNELKKLKEINYPNSLGFLWEKFSKYLGFSEYDAAKLMGLASYGKADKYKTIFNKILSIQQSGDFAIDNNILRFRLEDYSQLEKCFGLMKLNSSDKLCEDYITSVRLKSRKPELIWINIHRPFLRHVLPKALQEPVFE